MAANFHRSRASHLHHLSQRTRKHIMALSNAEAEALIPQFKLEKFLNQGKAESVVLAQYDLPRSNLIYTRSRERCGHNMVGIMLRLYARVIASTAPRLRVRLSNCSPHHPRILFL